MRYTFCFSFDKGQMYKKYNLEDFIESIYQFFHEVGRMEEQTDFSPCSIRDRQRIILLKQINMGKQLHTSVCIPSSLLPLDLAQKTFTNLARCSKCFVISVARIISMMLCRSVLYVSRSRFLNMFTRSSSTGDLKRR